MKKDHDEKYFDVDLLCVILLNDILTTIFCFYDFLNSKL